MPYSADITSHLSHAGVFHDIYEQCLLEQDHMPAWVVVQYRLYAKEHASCLAGILIVATPLTFTQRNQIIMQLACCLVACAFWTLLLRSDLTLSLIAAFLQSLSVHADTCVHLPRSGTNM